MPTFKWFAALAFVASLTAAGGAGAQSAKSGSAHVAYEQGIDAIRAGRLDLAVSALRIASDQQMLPAEYYLARIYSDDSGPYADHAEAYRLFQRIVETYADIDAQDDRRTPFVAKSLVALAGYMRRGLADHGVKADATMATRYLQHAATVFNDADAQFELARHALADGRGPEQIKLAIHWLAVLTQRGHPGAQAFLADSYWRGKFVTASRERALALATIAVENAPGHDRIWIEDIHHEIYCAASPELRQQVDARIPEWRLRYARARPTVIEETGLPPIDAGAVRTCANGEVVVSRDSTVQPKSAAANGSDAKQGAVFLGATGSLKSADAAPARPPAAESR